MSAASETAPARRRVRPFYWSVRRELWENRAVYLAPLAVAAVALAGFLFASHGLAQELRVALGQASGTAHETFSMMTERNGAKVTTTLSPSRTAGFAIVIPYAATSFAVLVTTTLVGIFYALGALYGERRDRTVLFWKSLPVSDTTTVLSKAVIPLIVLPLVGIAVALATQLLMLAWSFAVVSLAGLDPAELLTRTHIAAIFAITVYGFATLAIWWAPIAGWLLLVSAWAKRMTVLWAVAPPAALSLFEFLAFRTDRLWRLITTRLHGGDNAFQAPPSGPHFDIDRLLPDPLRFLSDPGVWGGLVFFAACLAACVWLRRRRDPI